MLQLEWVVHFGLVYKSIMVFVFINLEKKVFTITNKNMILR